MNTNSLIKNSRSESFLPIISPKGNSDQIPEDTFYAKKVLNHDHICYKDLDLQHYSIAPFKGKIRESLIKFNSIDYPSKNLEDAIRKAINFNEPKKIQPKYYEKYENEENKNGNELISEQTFEKSQEKVKKYFDKLRESALIPSHIKPTFGNKMLSQNINGYKENKGNRFHIRKPTESTIITSSRSSNRIGIRISNKKYNIQKYGERISKMSKKCKYFINDNLERDFEKLKEEYDSKKLEESINKIQKSAKDKYFKNIESIKNEQHFNYDTGFTYQKYDDQKEFGISKDELRNFKATKQKTLIQVFIFLNV